MPCAASSNPCTFPESESESPPNSTGSLLALDSPTTERMSERGGGVHADPPATTQREGSFGGTVGVQRHRRHYQTRRGHRYLPRLGRRRWRRDADWRRRRAQACPTRRPHAIHRSAGERASPHDRRIGIQHLAQWSTAMPSHGDVGVDLTGPRTPNLTQPDQWLLGIHVQLRHQQSRLRDHRKVRCDVSRALLIWRHGHIEEKWNARLRANDSVAIEWRIDPRRL
jgi:hypothetical protein